MKLSYHLLEDAEQVRSPVSGDRGRRGVSAQSRGGVSEPCLDARNKPCHGASAAAGLVFLAVAGQVSYPLLFLFVKWGQRLLLSFVGMF